MALRIENRVPAGDANPYVASAAMLAAGIHTMDRNLALEEALVGDAYAATGRPSFPKSLQEARELFADSEIALEAFGEVVGHYLSMARDWPSASCTLIGVFLDHLNAERIKV